MKIITYNDKGFTLIELLVSVSIFTVLMVLGGEFIVSGFRATRFNSEQETAVSNARKAFDTIFKEVKEARISEKGDYPIFNATTQTFGFYGDYNDDNKAEKIKYIVENNTLKKVSYLPGADNNYLTDKSTTTIAQYVNNQAETIFTYYNSQNIETANINDIRMVNVRLKINVNPAIAPQDVYIESDIQLRNLKDNL